MNAETLAGAENRISLLDLILACKTHIVRRY
jgi:hypothetical protein